jgi:4-carboxymuconolactone decarboxylase
MSQLLEPRERADRGTAIGDQVRGHPGPAPTTPLEESWRDFVFAEVWNRPGLDRRARYLIAIAGSVISVQIDSILDGFVQGALKSGELSVAELREAALHLAVYTGWGRGQRLDLALYRAAQALGLPPADCPPIRAEAWDPEVRTAEGMAEFTNVMTFPGGPSASPFLEAINNFVFGEMWCRPGLDQRSRRWLTLVGVCESAAEVPFKSHIHSAMQSGNCTPDELQEFVLQYGILAGWPKASVIQGVVWEMIKKFEAGQPWNG